ncbi:NAD(P)-dependent oxidoreductase [candidate division KSB1 bacterium]|nr:NAD(P)-dependent oxidoreductase [candidate division KSB1 bacterium]
MTSVDELEDLLSRPTPQLERTVAELDGDFMILGAGGKMGPTLTRMAKRALDNNGDTRRVIAVDTFPNSEMRDRLERSGIETIQGNLLDSAFVADLPDADNIIYMVGMKFGSVENVAQTWGVNTYLPTVVAQRFKDSRITAFSTGNVYPMVPIKSGGCTEETAPEPIGDYAQSCLGRERMFQFFSDLNQTPVCIARLNYAVELRYGVLVDIAQNIQNENPIDVTMGYFNVIWQGDANAMIINSLSLCRTPAAYLNVAGPETVSLRWAAHRLAELLGKEAIVTGEEETTAFLNNAGKSFQLYGYPSVSLNQMLVWIADWIKRDMPRLNKPTHFQERKGKF